MKNLAPVDENLDIARKQDISAAAGDVTGPASSTDGNFALYDGGTGKKIKDGPALVTTVGATGADTNVPTEQAVREAIAAIPSGLPTTGGTMSGDINMGNQDISYLKLLKLNGEINDGNSGTAKVIDWNAGAAHKSTLTGNVTLAFTGIGATLIPAMTSNTAPSGEASNSQSSTDAYLSFDAGQNTYSESRPTSGQWVKYAFPQGVSKTPIAYRLQWYDNSHSCASWSFQASNNNVDWTTLDTKTAQSPGGTLNTYTFSNTTAYRYFRFLSSSNGQGFDPALCTFEIAEGTIDPTSPCFLTLKLVQDATGGRTVTWPSTVKGSPVINQAANSVSNVLFYWDGTSYWTLNGLPWVGVPASASAAGFVGQMAYDASYIYVCTAANTWKRVAIATW